MPVEIVVKLQTQRLNKKQDGNKRIKAIVFLSLYFYYFANLLNKMLIFYFCYFKYWILVFSRDEKYRKELENLNKKTQ